MRSRFVIGSLLVTGFTFLCNHLSAQDAESFRGKLIDSKTNESIPFATLRLKNKNMGVISNAEGDFQFPIRIKSLSEAIEISCIGYVTKTVALNDLSEVQLNVIKLQQAVKQLSEVVINGKKIRGLSPNRIVELAIEAIPKNYPVKPFSYVAYYRDYQFKDKESEYVNLNEAIVEVFDTGFESNDQLDTQIKLYEYKRNTDFATDSATEIPYDNKPAYFGRGKNKFIPNATLSPFGGNELSILRLHDAIRNYSQYSYSFVNVMKEDFVKNHFFKREAGVYLDNVLLYCISFESKPSVSGAVHFTRGKIFIEKDNYAIHKIEYACYNKTMRETQLMYDIQLEYARKDSLMYINYISFNNFFKTRNERDFRMIGATYDRAMNAFILNFNNDIDRSTTLVKSNYEFKLASEPLEIWRVEPGAGSKQVYVVLTTKEATKFLKNSAELSSKLEFSIRNIRDVDNRELDKVTVNTVQQFRELFVQKINPVNNQPVISNFRKEIPLSRNVPEHFASDNTGYWMNSPLKTKERSH
jgi:hypothetical protein